MSRAVVRVARPLGIGFRGFCKASRGASTRSLSAPIETWMPSIAAKRRAIVGASPPASAAIAAVANEQSRDGNRWTSRTMPATEVTGDARCASPPGGSDVHELVEVGHEVLD